MMLIRINTEFISLITASLILASCTSAPNEGSSEIYTKWNDFITLPIVTTRTEDEYFRQLYDLKIEKEKIDIPMSKLLEYVNAELEGKGTTLRVAFEYREDYHDQIAYRLNRPCRDFVNQNVYQEWNQIVSFLEVIQKTSGSLWEGLFVRENLILISSGTMNSHEDSNMIFERISKTVAQ